jgi:NAD(P)-dependent dehydrogenase (short-subunit alcohol dehydrogenase family)
VRSRRAELARAGARVVLACRNLQKGERARRAIETAVPGAQLELEDLDLADDVAHLVDELRVGRELEALGLVGL